MAEKGDNNRAPSLDKEEVTTSSFQSSALPNPQEPTMARNRRSRSTRWGPETAEDRNRNTQAPDQDEARGVAHGAAPVFTPVDYQPQGPTAAAPAPYAYGSGGAPNPFQNRTADETLGFMPPAKAIANNNALAAADAPPQHTQAFLDSFEPMEPGHNPFDPRDPPVDSRRLANVLGGLGSPVSPPPDAAWDRSVEETRWQPRDQIPANETDQERQDREERELQEGVGKKKTHRGKRGGKLAKKKEMRKKMAEENKRAGGRRVRDGRVEKSGGVGTGKKDHGEFAETEEFWDELDDEEDETMVDPRAMDKSYRRRDERDDGGRGGEGLAY